MKNLTLQIPSPLTEIEEELLTRSDIRLYLKRDDLIHPEITGNKWRKLKYNLAAAKAEKATTLLTFGGAYSNHIKAVAAAGHYLEFDTIGVVRGERHEPLNEILASAHEFGMNITYMNRQTYRRKHDNQVIDQLRRSFGDFYLIPEGGTNALALRGAAELAPEIDIEFDVICCSSGTGGTLAGIAHALDKEQQALGFAALKGADFLNDDVRSLQSEAFGNSTANWSIEKNYHFGGYAKRNIDLDNFIDTFRRSHDVELDWVYEAKMMYGIYDLINQGKFDRGTTLVAVIAG